MTDSSPAVILDILLSIKKDTASIVSAMGIRVDALEKRVETLESHPVCKVEDDIAATNTRLDEVIKRLDSSDSRINLMTAQLQMSDTKQKSLEHEIVQLKSHSMKKNIIFNIDASTFQTAREIKGENCYGIIRHFLAQQMSAPDIGRMFISAAHRIGPFRYGKTRPILAQFPIASEIEMIMKNSNRLRNTNHFISRQMPPEIKERHQFVYPTYKEAKTDANSNAHMYNGRLYLQGKEQIQYSPPVLPVLPYLSADPERDDTSDDTSDHVVLGSSDEIQEGGSDFTGYAARISSLADITSVKQHLIMSTQHLIMSTPRVASASHLIMAYRYTNDDDEICENFDSNGDYGVGYKLLKYMRSNDITNIVFYATRHCNPGYKHIGATVCLCVSVCVCVCVRPIFWYFISRLLEEISI